MIHPRARIRLYGPLGQVDLTIMIDQGATLTRIPQSIARKLGLVAEEKVYVYLSDKSHGPRGLTAARAELDGSKGVIPVMICPDEENPVLGHIALEVLGYKVEASSGKLQRIVTVKT